MVILKPIPRRKYKIKVNGDGCDSGAVTDPWATSFFTPSMCSPVLLERLGPHILRAHTATANFKSIPHNEPVDLSSFRHKDPHEWGLDDVIAWMMSVAVRYSIPVEDLSMHRFACTGVMLMLMSQQNFVEKDSNFGYLLYAEFRKLLGDETNPVDDWIRRCSEDAAGPCANVGNNHCLPGPSTSTVHSPSLESVHLRTSADLLHNTLRQGSVITKKSGVKQQHKLDETIARATNLIKSSSQAEESKPDDGSINMTQSHLLGNLKMKRNKDGKPRKRSQHSKGNKLWEFIRDALKDPGTCPSVVRWEDPKEGVFRIVESETLARLWGEKKNNQKMTYEKLSRAMRTYYDKYILVPVPKTGLYPKKLVYKFGPNAYNWMDAIETTVPEPISPATIDLDSQESPRVKMEPQNSMQQSPGDYEPQNPPYFSPSASTSTSAQGSIF